MYFGYKIIGSCIVLAVVLDVAMFTLLEISYYSNDTLLQEYHNYVVDKFFRRRNNWTTSVLGSILFKNQEIPQVSPIRRNKIFEIFIWKHWDIFNRRYNISDFSERQEGFLEDCSVKNCHFTHNGSINKADAVIFYIRHEKILKEIKRNNNQKWIFYTDEPPNLTLPKDFNLKKFANKFNWSMTYRSDSDIPIPHGRTVPLKEAIPITSLESVSELVPDWERKSKTVLVVILLKDCSVKPMLLFIKELKKYMTVHFYGHCGDKNLKNRCTGTYFESDCKFLRYYHFYLVLEKSLCRQYLTEKVFHNAYSKGAIPIIAGPPDSDCYKLLPPNSYIHVNNFNSVKELAERISVISQSEPRLLAYHLWRAHFEVTDESGYFGLKSTAMCRVCEALNYNTLIRTVYSLNDLELFLKPKILCDLDYKIIKPMSDIPTTTPHWCYQLGFNNCVEL